MRVTKALTYSGLAAMVIVPIFILLLRGPTGEYGGGWWAEGATALAEALLVAGILGFTVDRLLKAVLVREVARLALRTIFGTNAPQEYVNSLQSRLQSIQLVHIRISWTVSLNWFIPGETLEVQTEWDADSINVSSTIWTPRQLRLKYSMRGAPGSRFDNFRVSVQIPASGNRSDVIHATSYSAQELQAIANIKNDGGVELPAGNLRMVPVPPGARRNATLKGTTFEPSLGSFPLAMANPSLGVTIRLTGAALGDLDVNISGGVYQQSLKMAVVDNSIVYEHGFVFPGTTFNVNWSPKVAEEATEASN